jgi:hypothetical protein
MIILSVLLMGARLALVAFIILFPAMITAFVQLILVHLRKVVNIPKLVAMMKINVLLIGVIVSLDANIAQLPAIPVVPVSLMLVIPILVVPLIL